MSHIVMKFGGTSVGKFSMDADTKPMEIAAKLVKQEMLAGNKPVVVVSALSGETNWLVDLFNKVKAPGEYTPTQEREYAALLATGEQQAAALMALTLQKMDVPAFSLTGWQVPIPTHGNLAHASVRTDWSVQELEKIHSVLFGREQGIPIVTGFQGVSPIGEISTLSRGGSDNSAVVLAGMIQAKRCDIYTDVNGVYSADPRIVGADQARRFVSMSYDEMLCLALKGGKVLQPESVALAKKLNVPLQVLKTMDEKIGSGSPGTLIQKVGMHANGNAKIIGIAQIEDISRGAAEVSVVGRNLTRTAVTEVKTVLEANGIDSIMTSTTDVDGTKGVSIISTTISRESMRAAVSCLHSHYRQLDKLVA